MDDILKETIESYNDYVKKIPVGSRSIAEKLREDQITEALNSIKDFTEGVIWLIDAGNLIEKNGVTIYLDVNPIQVYLNEINDGLQIQDYNLVADLFEYEIAPFFSDLKAIVSAPTA
ncbi:MULTISPECIES: hypothetical protein [Lysinibacillus]|uniref:Uncharacterized protein n=1 Tax=Lysinibacillus xylanilyticus TaxID=582475 RepID=A0ABV3VWV2_9BACI